MKVEEYSEKHFNEFVSLFQDWDKELRINREGLLAQIAGALDHAGNRILLVTEGDSVLAYAQTRECFDIGFESYVEIVQLLVRNAERSKGVGALLLSQIETTARGKGFSNVKLHSNIMRSRAHVFYERNGYTFYKCSKFYEKDLRK
jgi:GNAT superfamily N-acetyltransferase